ncbi:MAG: hypothetical protein CMH79_03490 [Nitrospinae bacterium]|nr:hypothetical protein [Nitrospinota bacterium]
MKVSTKGRYAVMAMVELALLSQSEPISLSQIARKLNISQSYLEQLFVKMRRSSLVISTRGPGGGYILAKPANEIDMKTLLFSVGEGIVPVEKINKSEDMKISRNENMASIGSQFLWKELEVSIHDTLSRITLADLCSSAENSLRKTNYPDFQVGI